MEEYRYMMHSFRVEGAASHSMDGTAMDVLVGGSSQPSHADTYQVEVTASAAAAGVTHFRGTFYGRGRPAAVREVCKFIYFVQRSHESIEAGPTGGQGRRLGLTRTRSNPLKVE